MRDGEISEDVLRKHTALMSRKVGEVSLAPTCISDMPLIMYAKVEGKVESCSWDNYLNSDYP